MSSLTLSPRTDFDMKAGIMHILGRCFWTEIFDFRIVKALLLLTEFLRLF